MIPPWSHDSFAICGHGDILRGVDNEGDEDLLLIECGWNGHVWNGLKLKVPLGGIGFLKGLELCEDTTLSIQLELLDIIP